MTFGKRKRFLAPEMLEAGVREIHDLARKHKVRIALLGGFAMQLYGSDRLTGDLDFVGERWLPGLEHGQPLVFGGEATQTPIGGVPVDLILRSDEYADLYAAALADAWFSEDLGVDVIRPEFLAAMKMVAGRDRDELDLKHLIAWKAPSLDHQKVRAIIRKHLGPYAVREFERVVDEVKFLGRR